uniref:ABC transporter permease n=1 Tax=Pararhizobium sp. IMCC3301 TaxID=3067904 RepID=UPI002741383D|nr:ABC transporter permease [Pararhizobium sp. IMCC3301]
MSQTRTAYQIPSLPEEWREPLIWLAILAAIIALFLPLAFLAGNDGIPKPLRTPGGLCVLLIAGALISVRLQGWLGDLLLFLAAHLTAAVLLFMLPAYSGAASWGFWLLLTGSWLLAWQTVARISTRTFSGRAQTALDLGIPILFGFWLLLLWEMIVVGAGIPFVLLPPPSQIGLRIAESLPVLWADFQQTFLLGVVPGYIIGCGAGFLVAVLVDRVPFLQRGLLPVGNMASALPIIGVAPIMVMWFGFGPASKIAVVVIMIFFPMLVNCVAGFASAGSMEKDLMRTYAASYGQTLLKLRLPNAMPFIFNALKINSTLALIGAIVAEFFGSPTVGMGFRISTEFGRLNTDLVWATIAVAALAGSTFYGLIALVERRITFWHPSARGR